MKVPVLGEPGDGLDPAPSTWGARTEQELTATPSSSTAQAPQTPSPQPCLASVRPAASRSIRSRVQCAGTSHRCGLPLRVKRTIIARPPGPGARRGRGPGTRRSPPPGRDTRPRRRRRSRARPPRRPCPRAARAGLRVSASPRQISSAGSQRSGRSPTPASASLASAQAPASSTVTRAVAAAVAKSSARLAISEKPWPVPGGGSSSSTRVSSSPDPTAVAKKPAKKSSIATRRSPSARGDHDLAAVGERDRAELGRGVGVAEAAAERAPVAHPRVADLARRLRRQRQLRAELRAALELAMTGERPERDGAVGALEARQRQPPDVDQQVGRGEAEAHHRDQALSAGDRSRLAIGAGERVDRLLDGLRARVLERARVHLRRPTPRRRRCRAR